jgi:hypothetical protein
MPTVHYRCSARVCALQSSLIAATVQVLVLHILVIQRTVLFIPVGSTVFLSEKEIHQQLYINGAHAQKVHVDYAECSAH